MSSDEILLLRRWKKYALRSATFLNYLCNTTLECFFLCFERHASLNPSHFMPEMSRSIWTNLLFCNVSRKEKSTSIFFPTVSNVAMAFLFMYLCFLADDGRMNNRKFCRKVNKWRYAGVFGLNRYTINYTLLQKHWVFRGSLYRKKETTLRNIFKSSVLQQLF